MAAYHFERALFVVKTAEKIEENTPRWGRRWNFAGALQPYSINHMPDVVATCRAFARYFNPERTRVVFLRPGQARRIPTGNRAD